MRYVCIARHVGRYPVRMMCRLLEVSGSGFYAWRGRSASNRERRARRLLVEIWAIHERTRQAYGSPRIWRALVARGEHCSRGQVARLMRDHGIRAKHGRK